MYPPMFSQNIWIWSLCSPVVWRHLVAALYAGLLLYALGCHGLSSKALWAEMLLEVRLQQPRLVVGRTHRSARSACVYGFR